MELTHSAAADLPATEPPAPLTVVHTAICDGMDTCLMQIECSFTRGFAGMQMIGYTSEVCRDGKERARAALESLGVFLPPRRLVVSLSPADVRKDGSQFDLPIAVSLALLLTGRTPTVSAGRWLFAAELGLMGELRPVKGVTSFALAALASGLEGLVLAEENLAEVSVLAHLTSGAKTLKARTFSTLAEVLAWLFGDGDRGESIHSHKSPIELVKDGLNFDDMVLTPELETVAEVTATGMHSLLLRGSPGTGKSMFAARLTSILPDLGPADHVEAMRIYSSMSERLPMPLLSGRPPYRAPHHQASSAAIMGGPDCPGEMALAHGGVLFLDELPEFRRDLIEALREPLETGRISVARARKKATWRARVALVAACNNCPCGWSGSSRRVCICGMAKVLAYKQRLSGPILDRIDLHVNMPEATDAAGTLFVQLSQSAGESPTGRMRQRVELARAFGERRNQALGVVFNRDIPPAHLLAASGLEGQEFARLMGKAIPRSASRRTAIRTLRVARTLADLKSERCISLADLTQAWSWQADPCARARGEQVLE